jgi:hypothetical protein
MRRSIAVAALLAFSVPLTALAAEPDAASDPMQGWSPPKIKKEKQDRAEIAKLFKAMEAAAKKGDIETAASLIDFPVLMLTDDSKGEAHGAAWTREQWMKEMEPFYKPMPDMKVKEKPTVFLLTDSLATVTNVATITMGNKKPMTTRNSMMLARVGGEWKVKAMAEGGWGDAMAVASEGASATEQAPPATSGELTSPSGSSQTAPSATPGETAPPAGSSQTAPPAAPGQPEAPGQSTAPGASEPTESTTK